MTGRRRTRTTPTSPRRPTRKRPSTGATLGSAVGALIAAALFALLDQMPWWLWVVLVIGGLGVGYLVHRRTGRKVVG